MEFQAHYDPDERRLRLAGDCRMADAPALERALAEMHAAAGGGRLALDLTSAGEFDIGPSWLLRRALVDASAAGAAVTFVGEQPEHFRFLDELAGNAGDAGPPGAATSAADAPLVALGMAIEARTRSAVEQLAFGGRVLVTAASAWTSVRRLRIPSVVRHAYETGVQAIPVVAMIAFLIAVISAYIGAQQLRPFGAEIYTVDLVAIGVLRELGVLLTAIMVAGRTGSAYAAEIGVMRLNEEVDALESMGLDPYEVLVLPRVLGLMISLPLLTIVADFMGLAGGGMLTHYLTHLPWPQFFARLDEAVGRTTFWAGLIKAPVFGLLIGLTGTLRGLQVRESSRELGRLTTVAVVQSIFLVIFADALFAVYYLEIDF
jgi:phospholipid/cholesterol/gamma-HCH transport system permease protein